ncbi:MAG: SDR family oxidoreductase, partial [Alphaproteobacteria bacterium]|nr:SDR family oxidoreductase [Alphaproteobacteria bacterium]
VGMSKAIALEYAKRGITVNCVAPGAIKTPMTDVVSDEAKERFLAKIPVGYMADPIEIAYAICFLASKESSYITGQTIHVNGGMYMG